MIKRDAYDALIRLAGQFPVVAITGPRQSGKTTLARMAFPEKRYVSFDDKNMRELAKSNPGDFLRAFPDGAIIDDFYTVTIPDAAMIAAITPDGNILLKKEYRYGILKTQAVERTGTTFTVGSANTALRYIETISNPNGGQTSFLQALKNHFHAGTVEELQSAMQGYTFAADVNGEDFIRTICLIRQHCSSGNVDRFQQGSCQLGIVNLT